MIKKILLIFTFSLLFNQAVEAKANKKRLTEQALEEAYHDVRNIVYTICREYLKEYLKELIKAGKVSLQHVEKMIETVTDKVMKYLEEDQNLYNTIISINSQSNIMEQYKSNIENNNKNIPVLASIFITGILAQDGTNYLQQKFPRTEKKGEEEWKALLSHYMNNAIYKTSCIANWVSGFLKITSGILFVKAITQNIVETNAMANISLDPAVIEQSLMKLQELVVKAITEEKSGSTQQSKSSINSNADVTPSVSSQLQEI